MLSSGTAFAATPEEFRPADEDYTVTFSQDEITDVDELIDLALKQFEQRPATYDDNSTPGLIATQVLEEREYNNGKKEQEILQTNILFVDEDGSPLSPAAIWEQDRDGTDTGTISNVTATLKFNYIAGVQNSVNYIRPQRVSLQVTKNPSNYVVSGEYGWNYEADLDGYLQEDYRTVSKMITGSVYSWSLSSLGRFDLATPFAGFGAIAIVNANGRNLELSILAEKYNDFWN